MALYVSPPLDDARRGLLVHGGDLVVFPAVPPLAAFRDHVEELIRGAFAPHDPTTAQSALERDDFLAAVAALQRRYREDPTQADLLRSALEHAGVDADRTCWDRPYLRVLPSIPLDSRRTDGLGAHRDTWSSNVYAQTNWWTPIFPLTAERTMAFYPAYWANPLANTSADWDLEVLRAQGRAALPLVPEATEPMDTSSELRVVVAPGDVLCFSGAHLHASVPNTTDVTRFSVEVRTVHVDDVRSGHGAPNVDGAAPRVPLEWFVRLTDATPLPALVSD